jgi:dienelactone hydrolase
MNTCVLVFALLLAADPHPPQAPASLPPQAQAAPSQANPTLPPPATGTVRFEPVGDESSLPERYRLAAHEFPFARSFIEPDSRRITLSEVTFPSPVVTDCECNNTVHCEYFQPLVSGRRPAVVVLHILGGDFPLARLFCRYLSANGTAALFVKMPYYGPRRPEGVNRRMISADPHASVAGFTQAVLDIRRAAAFLASRPEVDPERIGIFGVSLGGITASLAGAIEPRFTSVCTMLAGGDLARLTWNWNSPSVRVAREAWLAGGRTEEQFFETLKPVEPAEYAERLRGRRLLMINASRDELIPPDHTVRLWEKAGRPRIVWYDAGHYSALLFLFDGLSEVTRFFQSP